MHSLSVTGQLMRDIIGQTFVILLFANYLVVLGLLVVWTVRTWFPGSGKSSGAKRSHGTALLH
jgi:hypothetical protein